MKDPVGISEIAERAGVTNAAASNWRRRFDTFPEPAFELKQGGVWEWDDVAAWIAERKARRQQALESKIAEIERKRETLLREMRKERLP